VSPPLGRAVRGALAPSRRGPRSPHLFARVRSTDTYLISFPRSGSTWLRCLLTALVRDMPVTPELVQATVPDVHRSDRSHRPPGQWGLVKSHAPYADLPARVVYLVRDGRDVMLSYWAHQRTVGRLPSDVAPGAFVLSPDVWPCPWHQHVAGWLDGCADRPDHRWLVLRYEDLERDPATGLAQVATLAGIGAKDNDVARAVERATRDRLRVAEVSAGPGSFNHLAVPRPSWPAGLSAQEITSFLGAAGPVLERLGYEARP
jgi:estrone sulfotransferase